jgi:hypothetical protein
MKNTNKGLIVVIVIVFTLQNNKLKGVINLAAVTIKNFFV